MINYYVGRSFDKNAYIKHKLAPTTKDIVGFEMYINWDLPVWLCEGAFDAMAIKRNAIPIFGKFIPKLLMKKIFETGVSDIYIMLDMDAQKQALHYTNYFSQQGIRTRNIIDTKNTPVLINGYEYTLAIPRTRYISLVINQHSANCSFATSN